MAPVGEHGDQIFCNPPFGQKRHSWGVERKGSLMYLAGPEPFWFRADGAWDRIAYTLQTTTRGESFAYLRGGSDGLPPSGMGVRSTFRIIETSP
jgi:hypothetical protein